MFFICTFRKVSECLNVRKLLRKRRKDFFKKELFLWIISAASCVHGCPRQSCPWGELHPAQVCVSLCVPHIEFPKRASQQGLFRTGRITEMQHWQIADTHSWHSVITVPAGCWAELISSDAVLMFLTSALRFEMGFWHAAWKKKKKAKGAYLHQMHPHIIWNAGTKTTETETWNQMSPCVCLSLDRRPYNWISLFATRSCNNGIKL